MIKKTKPPHYWHQAKKFLSKKDKKRQVSMLVKSRKLYKKKKYFTRKKVASYKSKTSNHILNARKIYGVENIFNIPVEERITKILLCDVGDFLLKNNFLHNIIEKFIK